MRQDDDRSDDRGDPRDDDRDVPLTPPDLLVKAGYVWLGFGVLILINAALIFGMMGADKQAGPVSSGCTAIFTVVIGIVFIHVGRQSINGAAVDTLGNAVGSILIGLLQGGSAAVFFMAGEPVLGAIQAAAVLGLVAAGVMAIAARGDYLDWRKAQKRQREDRPRRSNDRDDRDDRDRFDKTERRG